MDKFNHIIHSQERTGDLFEQQAEQSLANIAARLTAAERIRIINTFNDTEAPYPKDKSITVLFEEQAARTPGALAVVYEDEELSYRELNGRSNQLARYLREKGVKAETLVPLCMERSAAMIIGILGILKAGGAYVPVDPEYPQERISYMLGDTGAKLVISDSGSQAKLADLSAELLLLDEDAESISRYAAEDLSTAPGPGQLAYVIYTSGSTGTPKGVMVEHGNVVNYLLNSKTNYINEQPGSGSFIHLSYTFDASVTGIFMPLLYGKKMVIGSKNSVDIFTDPNLFKYAPYDFIKLTPAHLQLLPTNFINAKGGWLTGKLVIGGEALLLSQLNPLIETGLDIQIINEYGPTEATVGCSTYGFNTMDDHDPQKNALPIGKPISNAKIYILNETGQLQPAGVPGELYIGGDGVARGYLNKEGLTAEKFITDPFQTGANARMYRTGDLGKWLPDGNIAYLGRIDDQVKVRGYRIELGEIESVLQQSGLVKQAVVLAKEDGNGAKRLIGYIVLSAYAEKRQVIAYLQAKLPEYMVPALWVELERIPLTSNGKTDRGSLPEPEHSDLSDRAYTAPRTPTEKQLAEIWQDILEIDKIGATDDFFNLGGDSLLAIKTVVRLKKLHNYDLPITTLYQYPSIAGIAAYLDGNLKTIDETLISKAPIKYNSDDIAVIGMAGRFPGANTIDELWQILADGRETIKFFTDDELDPFIPGRVKNAPNYVKARGIIDGADEFDPMFFNLSPKVAELMDPQQRIFLEVAWEALESTGYLPSQYKGLVGVFAGCGNNTYFVNNVIPNPHLIDNVGYLLVTTVNEKDYIASRTAYELNLKGPAVGVYSACSTSLLAIATAVESIRNGQCSVALAGGSSIFSPIKSGHLYQQGTMLSADGHCRSFDAHSDGTVFSDGAGVVVLKRLEEAIKDGDTIFSVIKGVGVNNDGGGKSSFTAPNSVGQSGAIAMAIRNAGISPADISYVETHGTATLLGDPIEIEGLKMAFGPQEKKQYCAIGSIKSNIGHLTVAAGVAGFIKTTLSLYNKKIPASLFYNSPNPNIDFKNSPFYVNTRLADWNAEKRVAGVSSFGIGGTNVHLILEEYPHEIRTGSAGRDMQLITWSAKTETSAAKYRESLSSYLKNENSAALADIAYTLQTTRTDFNNRYFIIADNKESLAAKLMAAPDASSSKKLRTKPAEIVFMFPGQGSQFLNMGRELYEKEQVFTKAVNECVNLLKGTAQEDILTVIFNDSADTSAQEKIKNTLYTQPALFIISYAMARLWISWGIEPAVLTGHSIGEFVAAHFAGVFSLPEAVKLIAARAKMVSDTPAGSMVSVRLSEEELKSILPDGLFIAVINGSRATVAAGPEEEINKFIAVLDQKGIANRVLQTSHAFHSAMMDPIVAPFEEVVKTIKLNPPVKPVISTITGKWMSGAEATDPGYWARHLRETVRFADVAKLLLEDDSRIVLETGPGNILTALVRQQAAGKPFAAINSMEQTEDVTAYPCVLKALGQLWLNGAEPDWKAFYNGQDRLRVNIPNYAFDRKRYWVDPAIPSNNTITSLGTPENILIDNLQETPPDMPARKDILIEKLKNIFEDASGIDIDNTDISFIETGFDSLLLTQVTTKLKKEFNIPITFRRLFEDYNSLSLLAAYLDGTLPADKFQPAAAAKPAVMQPVYKNGHTQQNGHTPVYAEGGTQALNMIAQQLQLLASQVAGMQNGGIQHTPATMQSGIPITQPGLTGEKTARPTPSLSLQADLTPEEQIEVKKPFGATAKIEKQVRSLNSSQQGFLNKLITAYSTKTKGSKEQTQKHRSYMADPRVVSGFRPLTKEIVYPVIINRSKGCRLWDIDGNEYIDALNGFGSNMLGYQPDIIKKAIADQLEKGYEIGPQHELAGEVCKLICDFTGFDRAALCSTGSEGVLGAMRIARTVTGRSIIVAFSGSYHGIMDEVIVRGTKKLRTIPAAPGIMPEAVQNMLILGYGTDESLRIIEERKDEIAAVLVEVVQSRQPEFLPVDFLKKLRAITAASQTALIFDEVITGFRMHPGGIQAITGIRADIGTYGKVIGGGLPIGVIAGKKEFMDALDGGFWEFGNDSAPDAGVTYFAGTFVRHPLALAATKASLLYMKERGPALQQSLTNKTTRLANALNAILIKYNTPMFVAHFGSLWKVKYHEEFPYSELLFSNLRLKGIHIMDSFPCFITDAHGEAEIDTMIARFEESVSELVAADFIPVYKDAGKPLAKAAQHPVLNQMVQPPIPGAKLGRDRDGNPGWFISDEKNPGKYLQVEQKVNYFE